MTKQTKTGPRILVLDIETSPILGYVWSLWNNNLGLAQVKKEWCILSFAAKWLGEKKVIYHDTFDQEDREDDSALIALLWDLLDEADIMIAHNGKQFDLRKIKARMFEAGYLPFSPIKVIDTLLETRKNFMFTSAKLEALTKKNCVIHKLTHKKFPGFLLWKEYLAGNPLARKEMREYNKVDVTSLEEFYILLRPWIDGHPNLGVYTDSIAEEEHRCPNCASTSVQRKGTRRTQVGVYPRYRCGACGTWSRGRLTINPKQHKAQLLVN